LYSLNLHSHSYSYSHSQSLSELLKTLVIWTNEKKMTSPFMFDGRQHFLDQYIRWPVVYVPHSPLNNLLFVNWPLEQLYSLIRECYRRLMHSLSNWNLEKKNTINVLYFLKRVLPLVKCHHQISTLLWNKNINRHHSEISAIIK